MKVVRTELRYCKRDLPREMNRPPFFPFCPFFSSFFSLARSSCLGRFGRRRPGGKGERGGNLSGLGLYEVERGCRATHFLPATVFGIHTRLVRLSLGIS
jgi:hypothetical protein